MNPTSNTPERWLPVPGYEGAYEVSEHGNVRSVDRITTDKNGRKSKMKGRALAKIPNGDGRLRVQLSREGSSRLTLIHRLVLLAFVGPCPHGMECCHWDGDPTNNRLENLRWGTHTENMQDKMRIGNCHQTNKTHCFRGHLLIPGNLILSDMKKGKRRCKACDKAREWARHRQISHSSEEFRLRAIEIYDDLKAKHTALQEAAG